MYKAKKDKSNLWTPVPYHLLKHLLASLYFLCETSIFKGFSEYHKETWLSLKFRTHGICTTKILLQLCIIVVVGRIMVPQRCPHLNPKRL